MSELPFIHRHFILHKPFGFISQFKGQPKNKKLLGQLALFPEGCMAIGRLDQDSEGLLLLTTDGKMSEYVRSRNVEKEYYAQVDGLITPESVEQLRKGGLEITHEKQPYFTLPCRADALDPAPTFAERSRRVRDDRHGPTSWVSIVLTEGKNRQIRKMTAAVGFPTLRLVRVRIGSIRLGNLAPGGVQEVVQFNL